MLSSEVLPEIQMDDDKIVVYSDEEAVETSSSTSEIVEIEASQKPTCIRRLIDFYWKQEFLILVVLAIPLAKAYPKLGAEYLYPEITATWLAVSYIFFMSGLCLRREEFMKALLSMRFNVFVLIANFFVMSSFVFGVSRALLKAGVLSQGLADGLAICGSLPVTTNMALVFTKIAGGNEAAAVFITATSNMIGVFLSPLLIRAYVGASGDVPLVTIFWKLALRVIVPLAIGNFLQFLIPAVDTFVRNNGPLFKRMQQYTLIFIVYTVFCEALLHGSQNSPSHILILILSDFLLQLSSMGMAWYALKAFFPDEPKLRVAGLFGCMHKTISIGVPLIAVIYKGDPNITLYTLPILIWHPMQLVVGTLIMPRLISFVQNETVRLDKAGSGVVDELNVTEVSEVFEEGRAPIKTDKMRQRTSIVVTAKDSFEEVRAPRQRSSILVNQRTDV